MLGIWLSKIKKFGGEGGYQSSIYKIRDFTEKKLKEKFPIF